MNFWKRIGTAMFVAGILALGAPAGAAQEQQPTFKPLNLIKSMPKGGFTHEDRQIAAAFLAERTSKFQPAPAPLVEQLAQTREWSPDFDAYARPVPRKLEALLSTPAEGTYRVLFNRSLYVIRTETGKIVDRIDPER